MTGPAGTAGTQPRAVVGVVGLGAMGSRMAARLLNAGHRVVVWNRDPAKTVALVEAGAARAASPGEAAAVADVVVAMVSDARALSAVCAGPAGILPCLRAGQALIVMCTVGPSAVLALAEQMPEGVDMVDALVLGSRVEAELGDLRIFVGASVSAAEHVAPVLAAMGRPVHVGGVGAGSAAKLVANGALLGAVGLLGESLALADALGLSRTAAFDVLATTPLAEQALRRRAAVETRDFPPRFALSLARKDADLVLAEAHSAKRDLRLAAAVRSWLADAERRGRGDQDYTAILAAILDNGGSGARDAG